MLSWTAIWKSSSKASSKVSELDLKSALELIWVVARSRGKRYIYRTGAAFVSTRLGLEQIPPLTAQALNLDVSVSSPGGLILAGSYVPKTTAQLETLIEGRGDKLATIVLQVEKLLESPRVAEETVLQASDEACKLIVHGKDVLVMTSRKLITGSDERTSLDIGSVVASALVLFLRMLNPRPRYLIAKVCLSISYEIEVMPNIHTSLGRDNIF